MTTERRLQTIEETLRMMADLNQTVVAMLAFHDEQLASIRENSQRMAELTQAHEAKLVSHDEQLASLHENNLRIAELTQTLATMLVSHDGQLASLRELVDEAREDNRMTRNLWVNLARRYGWLDDQDLQG